MQIEVEHVDSISEWVDGVIDVFPNIFTGASSVELDDGGDLKFYAETQKFIDSDYIPRHLFFRPSKFSDDAIFLAFAYSKYDKKFGICYTTLDRIIGRKDE